MQTGSQAVTLEAWLTGATAVAFLALGLTAGSQRGQRPLATHVGLMSAGLFAYDVTEVLTFLGPSSVLDQLGDVAASVTAIPTLELFIAFVGKTRKLTKLRYAIRAYFGALFVLGMLPLFFGSWVSLRELGVFAIAMLAGLVPGFGFAGWLLAQHARTNTGAERGRAQLIGAAGLVGGGSIAIDLAAMAGAELPHVSHFGLLAAAVLVAAATLRLRVVDRPSVVAGVTVGALSIAAVAALVSVYSLSGERTLLFAIFSVLILVALMAALRPLYAAYEEEKVRARYLSTMGRFSSQMAHDLRNPLAAIKGAAQFLEEELAQGRPLEPHADFLKLIVERADRMARLVADYQRMGRLELSPVSTDVNSWLGELLRGEHGSTGLRIETSLARELPRVALDRDLFSFAVENVLKNASEAMGGAGRVVAKTSRSRSERGDDRVVISLRDEGPGMDPRTRERALAGFFTTKSDGTGLGLAFVARVVDAHGGTLRVESAEGRGTEIVMELPSTRDG
jgi:signal transduction histidine kinase